MGCKHTYYDVIGGGSLEFHNIQEIVDIEWLFELICMFFCVFLSSLQMIRKRGNNSKTGESSKLLLYYCAIVKYLIKYIFAQSGI